MTLIAGLCLDDYPILLGDLLISGSAPPRSETILPTVGQPVNPNSYNQPVYTTHLTQKICIIRGN
jgi:hypothetical protein